jgi:hypothetical protein
MDAHVESAGARYFRCYRLTATITPEQCRINRQRCDALVPVIDLQALALEEIRAPCFHCPQAPQVDAGRVRLFTVPQVVTGHALAEPAAECLPWELRIGAQPSDRLAFTSAFWVPEWDL